MTSKHLLPTSVKIIARIAFSFSFLALVFGSAIAGPMSELDKELSKANDSNAEIILMTAELPKYAGRLSDEISQLADPDLDQKQKHEAIARLKKKVNSYAQVEEIPAASGSAKTIKQIKSSPLYHERGGESSNWLGRALERLRNIKLDLPERKPVNAPNLSGLASGVTYLMWTLLALGVAVFAWFVFKHVAWRASLKRKAKALLEDDEPERTLDEWLQQADLLESQGRFREAVRCLFLACLLRFDEGGVARFDRGQTNWEHLARIQQSPKLPDGLNFLPATQLFDQVWYGHRVRGKEDLDAFRRYYTEITDTIARRAA